MMFWRFSLRSFAARLVRACAQMRPYGLALVLVCVGCQDTPMDRLNRITMEACKEKGGIPHYKSADYSVTCDWPPVPQSANAEKAQPTNDRPEERQQKEKRKK